MFESVLRVKYLSLKTCFVYLSNKHKNLNTGIHIKLTYGDKNVAYFSASIIQNSVDVDSIGINSAYAKTLGINEDEYVNISQIEQLSVINNISIQPFTKSDYEVLEILSQNVQSNLLEQVRVVNNGQNLVIWIGSSISVNVLVDNVHPIAPGVLDFLTEVIIKPPGGTVVEKIDDIRNQFKENPQYMEDFLQFLERNSSPECNENSNKIFEFHESFLYRLIPLSRLPNIESKLKNLDSFTVYILKNSQCKDRFQNNSNNSCFYSMTLLNSPNFVKKLHIKVCFLEDIIDDSNAVFKKNNISNIFVNDSIFNFMQCEFGARVILKRIANIPSVKEIEVHSKKNYSVNVIEKLKLYLSDNSQTPFILNADFPIKINRKLYCSLKFMPSLSEFCIIDSEMLRNCSYIQCDEDVRPIEQTAKKCEDSGNFCIDILPVREACDNVFSIFCINDEYQAENIILTGNPGMGKTSLLNHIANIYRNYPYFIYTEVVSCKKIKGKTVDSLYKFFTDIIAMLIFCQPSILILDDLHVLCEKCEGEETPNTIYFARVSEMLYGLFSVLSKYNSIGILASAQSVSKLNKNIYRSRGNYLFKHIFAVGDLNKGDRIILLKHFLKEQLVDPNLDYTELSIKTDGFVIQDIEDLYNKILFEGYKDRRRDGVPIGQYYCDEALKRSCALSLQNVKFHSSGSKSFEDIGGLDDVKTVLIESFMWPVKYSTIFAKAPLRLQSGLLLYGPPGTGKTLLAGAAAKQCSLRLISIKGPELLSKYIGASEQAVRDVFEKAQRAKPCILFFDEFDSLAPRRGHDNTGVTDRVVNQLLTQLDGVEALTGVCVLAATSRPDLLDPALLRPGRLDKQLPCPMPKEVERYEILKILSKGLDLSDDVDLNDVAAQTNGYSGADLQSVLYTSQVSSIKNFEPQDETVVASQITQSCLLEALQRTRPSLTKSERRRYERIYAKFEGTIVEDFRAGSKVTLA